MSFLDDLGRAWLNHCAWCGTLLSNDPHSAAYDCGGDCRACVLFIGEEVCLVCLWLRKE